MVRWLRWHCPSDTGFEIRALAVWGPARYFSVTEAPHWLSHVDGEETFFVSFKPPRPRTEPRTLAWKAAVLTTTLGPPPPKLELCPSLWKKMPVIKIIITWNFGRHWGRRGDIIILGVSWHFPVQLLQLYRVDRWRVEVTPPPLSHRKGV